MTTSCRKAREWMAEKPSGLAEHDALRLEEHLSACSSCREEAVAQQKILELLTELPETSAARRTRAIDAALNSFQGAARPPQVQRSPWPYAALALAATVLLGLVGYAWTGESELVSSDKSSQKSGRDLNGAWLTATTAADLDWDPLSRTVDLRNGEVTVVVRPTGENRFFVETPNLRVEVTGTVFEVGLSWVRVARGSVRVRSRDGSVLRERLEAGEMYQLEVLATADDLNESALSPVDEATDASPSSSAPTRAQDTTSESASSDHAVDPSQLLREARRAVAARNVSEAESLIRSVLSSTHRPSHAAEAATLRAEIALVRGNRGLAIERYLAVSNRYSRLSAGENALFSAARLSLAQSPGAAERLFQQYLARYPSGRFRDEASRRLEQLP